MDELANRLRIARQAKGFTQRELAERVGTDQGHVSRLERKHRGVSVEILGAIARELGVTVSYLLGEAAYELSSSNDILASLDVPQGLRDLAEDEQLVAALIIEPEEWRTLSSMILPRDITKEGYVQLLSAVRAVVTQDFGD